MTTRAVRRRLAVAVLASCSAALTGCGTDLSPEVHPGAAAVVGDERIPLDTVDDMAEGFCDWQESRTDGAPQKFPMAFLRAVFVDHLVQSEVLEQYAAEHDLEAEQLSEAFSSSAGGAKTLQDYRALVLTEVGGNSTLEEPADAAIDLFMAQAVLDATSLAAGRSDDATLADDAAVTRGQELIAAWRDEQEIDIDPRFGAAEPGALGYIPPEDTLSVLAGERRAAAAYFEPAYVDELPASQRCG